MSPRAHIPRRVTDERGYVLVVVMALMVVAIAGAFALLASTLSAQQLTTRDTRVRAAQQAADAGLQATLYEQSETNLGATYNDNGGLLGLSNFLDCDVPQVNASLQITGIVSLNAGTGGVCPNAENASGQATTVTTPIGNHAFYQAELVPNQQQLGHGTSSSSSEDLLFPEMVSIGCDATSISSCENGAASPTAVYSREELILAPIAPLQAIEGMGNVTINGLSALGLSALTVINGDVQAVGSLTTPLLSVAANTALTSSGLLPTFAAASFSGGLTTAREITASICQPGVPSTTCIIKRQPVSIANSNCAPCVSLPSANYNSSTHSFSMSSGTVSLTAGDYVFCNFDASGGTLNLSSGPVRIFIAAPNSSLCSGNGYTKTSGVWNGGNFIAANGVNNSLTGTVNGAVGALDPSNLQIYVVGDGGGDDNATTVSIGGTASAVTESMIIYAPTSSVTVDTGVCTLKIGSLCTIGVAGAFAGSIVGDNTSVTASGITQDLDIGNYPLYSGVNAFQPVRYVSCDTSVTKLADSMSDLNGC